ncbi:DUF505 domain-containing protein [Aquifex aeolicus]|uniref:DUF505 domain-containing protein n=1 Tax=Aquifex aeolicus (strain VF5) TaxID=224324 RepID=O66955_AQUAE|nr:DUF505 domain-containing protein [Aquifex aeolicus]AAC06921.1 putative protein [Aquifex aeolicus VF5]
MIIMREHALALLAVKEAKERGEPTYKVAEKTREEEVFLELEFQNLVRLEKPLEYTLTYWGEALVNLLHEMIDKGYIPHPENWDEHFRWIGSEIISMIHSTILNDGRPGEKIEHALMERGFLEEVEVEKKGKIKTVNEYAKAVYEIYNEITPKLEISRELAEYIRKMPPGPAEKSMLPEGKHFPLLLESMRLIAFSVPNSDVYALTGLGQAVEQTLRVMPFSLDTLISEDILEDFVTALDEGIQKLPEAGQEVMYALGLFDDQGNLLPAGEKLLEVYKLWKKKSYPFYRTFNLEVFEEEILKTIDKLLKKHQEQAGPLPTKEEIVREMLLRPLKEYKHLVEYYGRKINQDFNYKKKEEIKKKFQELKTVEELFKHFYEKGGEWYKKMMDLVTEALYSLESFDLITTELTEKGELYYVPTEHGKKVLEDLEKHGIRDITATGVKAITITKREFMAPNYEWYKQAVDEVLVRTGAPTDSGRLYSELAYTIKRKPHLTRFELMVLHKIPKAGMFLSELFKEFDEVMKEEVHLAVEKLQARGFLDVLPNEGLVLTKAGELIKEAVSSVPEGLGNPVNPFMYRIVEAISKVGNLYVKEEKVRILPKQFEEVEKMTGLDHETFLNELSLLRLIGILGQNSLHKSGLALLKAVEEIQKTPVEEV